MANLGDGRDIYDFLAKLDRSQDLTGLVMASGFFDPAWYRDRYMAGVDRSPIEHFVCIGIAANHDPSRNFSSAQYYDHYADVREAGMPAFLHFLIYGAIERRLYFPFAAGSYADLLAQLPDLSDVPRLRSSSNVAVVVHVYYPDIWIELQSQLAVIPWPFDLFVSLVRGKSDHLAARIAADQPNACIKIFPNHGRDVFPFTELLNAGAFDGCQLLCKLHTKKSLHRDDGAHWRRLLYTALLGSEESVNRIVATFRRDDTVGIFVPDGSREFYMGVNESLVRNLLDRIDIPLDKSTMVFPSGNMFWMSASCLALLKALNIRYTEYPFEAGQLDGTVAHAFERVIGIVCTFLNKRILTASDIGIA